MVLRAIFAGWMVFAAAAPILADPLRVFASRFYQVHTDLDPGLAQDLAKRLDVMYEEYSRRLIRFEPSARVGPINAYLFKRQEDYIRFAGTDMWSTGGVFIPSRDALAAFHDGQGRDNLRRTLQHEAFHQFAAKMIRYPLPMWLNEGIAQCFEEGLWTGDGFTLGQVPPRRVRQLQADIRAGRLADFRKFMQLNADQWASALGTRAPTRGATQYNQAWAMLHFLVNASDASGQPRFRSRLIEMLRLINEGCDGEQAFVQAFSDNYAGFRELFLQWANTLQPTQEATYIERQDVLADMLVAMKTHKKSFRSIGEFRDAVEHSQLKIQYSKGQIRWSTDDDTRIYFSRIDGTPLNDDELALVSRRSAPLPDIVCKCLPNTVLRTRFYKAAGKVEHELLFEPVALAPTMASPLRK